ncbi:hypothetical protein LXA43DRAFT_1186332 [Ganoderma leucocontextum]|nr:hypothetical protein LXA43DRAFT_1186332 [Ganoderma leucocontextum]
MAHQLQRNHRCLLTASVFIELIKQETLTKDDKSPVTDDPIVGEEDAADLRAESGKTLRDRITELAHEMLTAELQLGEGFGTISADQAVECQC